MTQALGALCPAWGLMADWLLALLGLGVSGHLIGILPSRRIHRCFLAPWVTYSYTFPPVSELCYESKRTSDLPMFSEPASGGGGSGSRAELSPETTRTPFHCLHQFAQVTEKETLVVEPERAAPAPASQVPQEPLPHLRARSACRLQPKHLGCWRLASPSAARMML